MIAFNTLPDDASVLDLCPLLRTAQMTLQYAVEQDGIGLTQTKAFKRVFVHWAAEHVDWPGMGYEELFRYNKVLNEYEFPPLEMTHFLLTQLKLGRHYKGIFKATKRGTELATQRGKLFAELIPFFVLNIDHSSYSRFEDPPFGNWDTWLNVINVEADHGADEKHLFRTFYGYEASWVSGNWREAAVFSSCVLKPLEWAGLLDHAETKGEEGITERHYFKTDLWRSALSLETDAMLKPMQRH
ncbi:MAG: hypothetical protein R8G60_13105 [Roseovarius pacificus]|nr:hypothetical protein [Roseovarius pacificus]